VNKQTLISVITALLKYSSFDIEDICHYAKGGPRKRVKPAKQVDLNEALMK
jgi:hypothetical protein